MTAHPRLAEAATDTTALAALHDRLVAAAAAADLLDVAYRTVDSPLGPLLLAATPVGVVRVAFDSEDHDDVLASLATTVSPRVLRAPARLDPAARALDAYFTGRVDPAGVPVDLRLAHGFRRTVLDRLTEIPLGARRSYAAVAVSAGSPRAVRAVGTACATNPVPLFVPCHRVVRSDGAVGAYRGGAAAKRILLDLEAGPFEPGPLEPGPPEPGPPEPGPLEPGPPGPGPRETGPVGTGPSGAVPTTPTPNG